MRRHLVGAAIAGVLGALPTLAVGISRPGDRALALDVYLLYLGGVLLLALVQATRNAQPPDPHSPFARELARRPKPRERLGELVRQEREVGLAMDAAFDLHVRLRPTLRAIAEHRLAARRGVGLDEQPERARELLGDDMWELVRVDREPPEDRFAKGIPFERLRAAAERLEKI